VTGRPLGERTWPAVAHEPPLLLVPVGSCEQHGPHLPLDTDTRVAAAVAAGAAERLPGSCVAPAVTVGASGEHHGFAGTLSIGVDALAVLLLELGRSADWATGIVLVNGHGGNVVAVRRAVEQLRGEGRPALAWSAVVRGGDAHAGRTETSLLLALHPELVDLGAAVAGRGEALAELLPALRADGVRAVSANGVLGDPAGASAAEGHAMFAELVADLVAAVVAWSP
jgi:mycofactocin precursor peptide peptidase